MARENEESKIHSSIAGYRLTVEISNTIPIVKADPNSIEHLSSGIAPVHIQFGSLEQIKEAIARIEESLK